MSSSVRRWQDNKDVPQTKGKWTEKEIAHLKRLLCKYASKKNLSPEQLASLCSDTTPPEFKNVWTKLASFFPTRSVQSVHNICKRHFNPFNYKGAWTVSEERTLIEFVEANGKKWKELGEVLQRTAVNVKDKWKQMGGENNKLRKSGAWNVEETKELVRLIFIHAGVDTGVINRVCIDNEDVAISELIAEIDKNQMKLKRTEICWETIAGLFKTRSSVDCRSRWNYIINYKVVDRMVFKKEDDLEIFREIRRQEVKSIEEIHFDLVRNGKSEDDNKFRFKVLAKATSGRLRMSLEEILTKLESSYMENQKEEGGILEYYTEKYKKNNN